MTPNQAWRESHPSTEPTQGAAKASAISLTWGMRKRMYRQAANQLENGRELTDVLADYRDRQLRRNRRKAANAIDQVRRLVVNGSTLASSMGSGLSDLERTLLSAGEKVGQLAQAMQQILEFREMTDRMVMGMAGSLFAPTVYSISIYAVMYVFGITIVPGFAEVAPTSKWTGNAYLMYLMGQFATGWAGAFMFGILIAYFGISIWALPRWTGKGRGFMDRHVFPFSTYREVAGFSWLAAFGTLSAANVDETSAIAEQMATANPWLRSRLKPIQEGIRNGLNPAAAMRLSGYDFPSADLIDEVGAYQGYPNFGEMIQIVCKQMAKTIERKLVFRGMVISALFSAILFVLMFIIQLGSNELGSLISSSLGI